VHNITAWSGKYYGLADRYMVHNIAVWSGNYYGLADRYMVLNNKA
jgi:hypothetical protein